MLHERVVDASSTKRGQVHSHVTTLRNRVRPRFLDVVLETRTQEACRAVSEYRQALLAGIRPRNVTLELLDRFRLTGDNPLHQIAYRNDSNHGVTL